MACAKASGDPGALAHALAAYARRAASLRFFDEAKTALAQAEAFPNNSVAIRLQLINHRAFLNLQSNGDVEAAARAYEELLNEYRSLGDDAEVRRTTLNLAEARHVLSETRRAIELARDVLPGARNAANRNLLVMLTMNLAAYHAAVDELPETCASAREAIREAASRDPAATLVAVALEPLALALALLGDVARAARLEGYADAAIRRDGFEREFTERKTRDRLRAVLAERLPPGELAQALADGATLSPDAAVALGLQDP